MNGAHFHLLLNHFPIVGLIIGSIVLLISIFLGSSISKKIALGIILVSSLFFIPTFASGEEAEEIIEQLPGFTEKSNHFIHEHEEKAESFMPFAWILIFLSAITLFLEWKKNKLAKYAVILILIVSSVAIYLVKQVGTSGGEISHPEIRKEFKPSSEHQDDHD